MPIRQGDTLPDATLLRIGDDGPKEYVCPTGSRAARS